ncbi:MAG: hypothetical protein IPJ65_31375 [Archangiaceae bacterium]|nr:hypothetical protein [Archangiaceae bacterium]
MLRAVAVSLCLLLPAASFAEEPTPPPALTPSEAPAAPQPAVENARWCGAHGGCGGPRGKAKWIIAGGVAGTVLTAVAVGLAVGVATHRNGTPVTP